MKQYFDTYDKLLKNGDVIDIHQTVNGYNKFLVFIDKGSGEIEVLYYDENAGFYPYQYNKEELITPDRWGDTDFEIIGNIFNLKTEEEK